MSSLRIIGILFSAGILIYAFLRFRDKNFGKSDIAISLLISGGLLTISIYPGVFNVFSAFFGGRYGGKSGRLFSIVIASNFILLALVLRLMARANATDRNLSDLVSALALDKFRKEYGRESFEKSILVVIPAYNEALNLPQVLGQVPEEIRGYRVRVLVVVDGATDDTEAVVRDLGHPVLINQINRGGGAALRAGYRTAVEQNAEIVVTMDADGQHLPEEIEKLVAPIIDGQAGFVCGSRVLGTYESDNAVRNVGIFLFNRLLSLLMRRRITDCSNAFRAIRVSDLGALRLEQDQFHTTEILIEAIKKGIRVKEVPVTVRKRLVGASKKPPSLRYGWGFFKAILRSWWRN